MPIFLFFFKNGKNFYIISDKKHYVKQQWIYHGVKTNVTYVTYTKNSTPRRILPALGQFQGQQRPLPSQSGRNYTFC